jgi:hypothetical protein
MTGCTWPPSLSEKHTIGTRREKLEQRSRLTERQTRNGATVMGQDAMATFWRGFTTGIKEGPHLFFAPLAGAIKGVYRICLALRGR